MKKLHRLTTTPSKFSGLNAVVSIFWTIGFCTAVFAAQPRISIDAPRGGELYVVGQQQFVHVTARLKSVDVSLSRDGGQTFEKLGTINVASTNLASRNSLAWTITAPASNTCLIRVSNGVFTATSGMFVIGAAPANGATVGGAGSVATQQLADGSVTTPKLADGAVTTPKIAPLAVGSDKISSGQASPAMMLTADGSGNANWMFLNNLDGATITSGTIASSRLPLAGTTPATTGVVYADNTSIVVAPDGKLSAVAAGVTLSGDVGGPANNNVISNSAVTTAKIANGACFDYWRRHAGAGR